MLIDLQLHSTYSDGYLTPTAVAGFIKKQGVQVASLTDHNTVGGRDEFRDACKRLGIKMITGLELYVKLHNYRFNLLWYNFNEDNPELHDMLRKSQIRRRQKMRIILQRLVKHGFKININKTLDKYNHYVPINRVIDDLTAVRSNLKKIKKELGLKNPREGDIIFEYFYNKKYGQLKNNYIDMADIITLKGKVGGQLVLCHPAKNGFVSRDFIKDLKFVGLDGIEVLSPHHSYGAVVYLQHLAREEKLITTGSSDFHRFEGEGHKLQHAWQYYRVDSDLLRGVQQIIG